MWKWINVRGTVLDEIVYHDGLRGGDGIQDSNGPRLCAHCFDEPGPFKCLNCDEMTVYCQACIIQRHDHLPLHCIEVRTQTLQRSLL